MKINLKGQEHLALHRDSSFILNVDELTSGGSGSTDLLVPITYSELKTKRNNGTLTPGMQYRITDYQCTTTQEDTSSAMHRFDIIVTADSSSALNENARAIQHAGDTYFSDNNLKVWELKYTIDNDNSVYGWADNANGKGVIYWMKDEFGNECPYDFKNILMKIYSISERYTIPEDKTFLKDKEVYISKRIGDRYSMMSWCNMELGSDTKYVYTFDIEVNNAHYDFSNNVYSAELRPACTITCYNNIIKPFSGPSDYNDYDSPKCLYINFITFTLRLYREIVPDSSSGSGIEGGEFLIYNNFFNNDCCNYRLTSNMDVLAINCHNNTFGINNRQSVVIIHECYNNIIGDDSERYIIDECCYNNTFGRGYDANVFREGCYDNIVGDNFSESYFAPYCGGNIIGNNCGRFTFGQYCYSNIFGNYDKSITFGDECKHNLFGNDCNANRLAYGCTHNKFGNGSGYNTLSTYGSYNTFGNDCTYNNFGNRCNYNTLNNCCSQIKLGTYCQFNTFGDACDRVNFGDASTAQSYFRYNIIENGNRLIHFKTNTTTSSSNYIQNVKIVQGVNNSNTYKTITHDTVNDTFQTVYQPTNSHTINV